MSLIEQSRQENGERVKKSDILVVKVGGAKAVDFNAVCRDVKTVINLGQQLVLVHGGSDRANELSVERGYPPRFVESKSGLVSRYTDQKTRDIIVDAFGQVRDGLVNKLRQLEIPAIGLTGFEDHLLTGKRKDAIRVVEDGKLKVLRGDYTGRVESVNTDFLNTLLDKGYVPVISPLAASEEEGRIEVINTDGDRTAAAIAGALKARRLIILTNVPGVLKDPDNPSSLITNISQTELAGIIENIAKGRMKKKIMGAQEALSNGIPVVIANSIREHPIQAALNGIGTVIQ